MTFSLVQSACNFLFYHLDEKLNYNNDAIVLLMGPKDINFTKLILLLPFMPKLYFVHDFIPNLKLHMSSTKVVEHMDKPKMKIKNENFGEFHIF